MYWLTYSAPLIVLWITVTLVNWGCVVLGAAARRRFAAELAGPEAQPFDVAYGAIFVLTALILGFSFSFATTRFDARRALVVREANAIGTTYLRAGYLPGELAARLRTTLREYAQTRLAVLASEENPAQVQASERSAAAMQGALWSIAEAAGRADPQNVQLALLTQTVNDTIDIAGEEAAAYRARVPITVVNLMLMMSVVASALVGGRIARPRSPQGALALLFGLLLATVVTAIVDLDRPQHGLVRVDLTSMQTVLRSMR